MARKKASPPIHPTEGEARALVAAFEYVSRVHGGPNPWHADVAQAFHARLNGTINAAQMSEKGNAAHRNGAAVTSRLAWDAAGLVSAAVEGASSGGAKLTPDVWAAHELKALEAMAGWLLQHTAFATVTSASALQLLRIEGAKAVAARQPAVEREAAAASSSRSLLGAMLAAARRHRGMSVEAAAADARLSATIWTRMERGTGKPDQATLEAAAKALGLTVGALMDKHRKAEALAAHIAKVGGVGEGGDDWAEHAASIGLGEEVDAVRRIAAYAAVVKA